MPTGLAVRCHVTVVPSTCLARRGAWLGQHHHLLLLHLPWRQMVRLRLLLLPSALILGTGSATTWPSSFNAQSDVDDLTSSPPLCWDKPLSPQQSARPEQTPCAAVEPLLDGHWKLFLPAGKCQTQCCSVASIMEQRCQTGTTKHTEILRSTAHPSTSTSVWYSRHQL